MGKMSVDATGGAKDEKKVEMVSGALNEKSTSVNSGVMEDNSVSASNSTSNMEVFIVPDSKDEDIADDKVRISECPRCGVVHHAQNVEACRRARRKPCSRCGLVHKDYNLSALVIDGLDSFDCEIYIPNVDELQMDENQTILLPDHVLKTY